jgi:hypothetical protein
VTDHAVSSDGGYAGVLRNSGWRRWSLAVALARMPNAMAPIALVLAGHQVTGSYSVGALMAGVYTLAEAVAAPIASRRAAGQLRRPLLLGLGAGALALGVLLATCLLAAPPSVLVGASGLAGALPAGTQGGFRAMLVTLVPAGLVEPAFALDATLLEVQWLSAPLVVAACALLGMTLASLAVMAVAGSLAFASALALPTGDAPVPSRMARPVWRRAAALPGYLASLGLGYTEGTVNVALPPLMPGLHARPATAGLLLALVSATSAVGGFTYAALGGRLSGSGAVRTSVLLAGVGLMALPIAIVPTLTALVAAVAAFGLLLAPLNAARTALIAAELPPADHQEAFAIQYALMSAGVAASGFGLALVISWAGPRTAVAIAGLASVALGVVGRVRSGEASPGSHPIGVEPELSCDH